jgi:RNA polymerase sigma-70 factor (ECF subfamily)
MVDWDVLVREHWTMVFGTAWHILGHAEDAEDVVQEVFTEAHQRSNGTPVLSWGALLRRIVICRSLNALHRRRAMKSLDAARLTATGGDPPAIAISHELETRLREALAELTPREAEVFCLRYFEKLSYREISKALGISATATSTALSQARSRLESLLTERNP